MQKLEGAMKDSVKTKQTSSVKHLCSKGSFQSCKYSNT